MSIKKCPECGGDIICHYKTPSKTFEIDDKDELKKVTPIGLLAENPHLIFVCQNDAEHEIENDKSLEPWTEVITDKFYDEKRWDE